MRYGFNVVEQWDHALREYPRFVFVTGWNEWMDFKWTDNSFGTGDWTDLTLNGVPLRTIDLITAPSFQYD